MWVTGSQIEWMHGLRTADSPLPMALAAETKAELLPLPLAGALIVLWVDM